MDRLVSKISESEMMQRWRAIEQAHAANNRQGYVHHPELEAVNERCIRGEIDVAGLDRRMIAAIRAGR